MNVKEEFFNGLTSIWEKVEKDWVLEAKTHLLSSINLINFNEKRISDIHKDFGLYLFQINPKNPLDWSEFENIWATDESGLIRTPNIYKSKFHFKEIGTWHPFYIGKGEKLSYRINEHCFQPQQKTTYGLKLSHRKNLLSLADFSYNYYPIENSGDFDKSVMQFVMTKLESKLRIELSPWVGKQ